MTDRGGDGSGGGDGIGCEEALQRVFEYLDGELDPDVQERIHRHLEVCQRCYPYFDFERVFLDYVREKGMKSEASQELRERVMTLLSGEGDNHGAT